MKKDKEESAGDNDSDEDQEGKPKRARKMVECIMGNQSAE